MQDRLENALRLAGATNFRNLGGIPAAQGRRIRPHALMRADRLSALSDADWRTLAGTGIVTICDLRSAAERDEQQEPAFVLVLGAVGILLQELERASSATAALAEAQSS